MNNYWCAWAISSWTGIFRQPSLFPASVCNWNRLRVEFQSEFYALRPSLSTAADFSSQVLTLGLTRSMFTFPWALLFLCAAVAHVITVTELQASYIYTYIISAFKCSAIVMITKKISLVVGWQHSHQPISLQV